MIKSNLFIKAHEMTREIANKYTVNYRIQFGISLKYLYSNKNLVVDSDQETLKKLESIVKFYAQNKRSNLTHKENNKIEFTYNGITYTSYQSKNSTYFVTFMKNGKLESRNIKTIEKFYHELNIKLYGMTISPRYYKANKESILEGKEKVKNTKMYEIFNKINLVKLEDTNFDKKEFKRIINYALKVNFEWLQMADKVISKEINYNDISEENIDYIVNPCDRRNIRQIVKIIKEKYIK